MKKIKKNKDPIFVGEVLEELNRLGYQATLIGGMLLRSWARKE